MAILQVLIALALRSLGRIANTALGWATVLLFGRIPQHRQIIVTTMALGSVVWLVAIAGIALPEFATFLLTFVTLPPWVNRAWIRLAMLAAASAIPLAVGAAALLLLDPRRRPRRAADIARALVPGYRYTFGMAVTLLLTALIAPITQIRTLLRRWATRHLPVVIHAEDYGTVVREIERILTDAGVGTRRVPTSPLVNVPTRMLLLLMGGSVAGMVTAELATFAGRDLEVTVHPFDIVISGPTRRVAGVQAALTEMLPFTPAYLTWTGDANEIEDRLREAWRHRAAGQAGVGLAALAGIEHTIRHTGVAFEEWEVLFREFLLVERRLRTPGSPSSPDAGVRRAG
ncbi:MAG TPA: hypothetical protein VGX97_05945 [bacterium]|nr:hypothetical protein [bacterium]